jgi:hypothetical protein
MKAEAEKPPGSAGSLPAGFLAEALFKSPAGRLPALPGRFHAPLFLLIQTFACTGQAKV